MEDEKEEVASSEMENAVDRGTEGEGKGEIARKKALERSIENGFAAGGSKKGRKYKRLTKHAETKAIELYASKRPKTEIATTLGVSRDSVNRCIKRHEKWLKELKEVQDFKAVRADLLSAAQLATLKQMMASDTLKASSFQGLAIGLSKFHNIERLERGLSTSNTYSQSKIFTKRVDSDNLSD